MKKVLIFENEYADLEPTFKAINLLYFDNALNITQFNTSQEFGNIDQINTFDAIIVDLDLSLRSHKDGYGIIHEINQYDPNQLKKLMILTGSTKVDERLKEYDFSSIKVAMKPIEMDEVAKFLKKIIS